MAEMFGDADFEVPDHLPLLDHGSHQPGSGKACVMEAASWLAGESWSDHPRTVHKAIARVAILVNDSVTETERQTLWPLLLASIGTRTRFQPLVTYRLHRMARRSRNKLEANELCELWEMMLARHFALTKCGARSISTTRLREFEVHLRAGSRSELS
jgi:hypothetical protein